MSIKFDHIGKQLNLGEVRGGKVSQRKILVVGRKCIAGETCILGPKHIRPLVRKRSAIAPDLAPLRVGYHRELNGRIHFYFWLVALGRRYSVVSFLVHCHELETDGVLNCTVQKPNA
jgi:hypothetical protein